MIKDEALKLALEALMYASYEDIEYDEACAAKVLAARYAIKEALAQPVPHRVGYWCVNLNCSKCYGAEFRFKHTTPPLPVQEPSTVKDYLTNETGPVQSDLLVRCETEMRYAGWINAEADNPQRQELYIAVCKALATPPLPVQEQLNKADAEWNKADAEFNKAYAEWSKADAEVVRIQKLIKEQALKEKNT